MPHMRTARPFRRQRSGPDRQRIRMDDINRLALDNLRDHSDRAIHASHEGSQPCWGEILATRDGDWQGHHRYPRRGELLAEQTAVFEVVCQDDEWLESRPVEAT